MKTMLAVLLLLCVSAPLYAADSLAGFYDVKGVLPDNNTYTATAQIVQSGKTYHIQWTFSDGSTSSGVAMHQKDQLVASFVLSGSLGLVVYTVKKDTLIGVWTMFGADITMTETLTRRKTPPEPIVPPAPVAPTPSLTVSK